MNQLTVSAPSSDRQSPSSPDLPIRIPSLDGLRGIAILLVCVGHAGLGEAAPGFLKPFSHLGNIGVRLFFLISGFLITTLLLRELSQTGTLSLRKFYLRRTFRIFPALYVFIAATLVASAIGLVHLKQREALYASFFVMNYFDYAMVWLGQTWSLAVEEQFYLLWPCVLAFGGLGRAKLIAWLAVLIALPVRFALWHHFGADETAMTKHFEAVMDALAVGCVLSLSFNQITAFTSSMSIVLFSCVTLTAGCGLTCIGYGVYFLAPEHYYIWGQLVANIGIAMCMFWAVRMGNRSLGKILNWRPLTALGTISYSLYLWQNPFLLGEGFGSLNAFPVNVIAAALCAWGSYTFIEKPFLGLKTRFAI